jgi:hypothetical protein
LIHINASSSVPVSFLHIYRQRVAITEVEAGMSATELAKRHFSAAIAEAEGSGLEADSVCRALLGLVVSKFLEGREVADVQSELRFVADNCDPDTDFMFMRP